MVKRPNHLLKKLFPDNQDKLNRNPKSKMRYPKKVMKENRIMTMKKVLRVMKRLSKQVKTSQPNNQLKKLTRSRPKSLKNLLQSENLSLTKSLNHQREGESFTAKMILKVMRCDNKRKV